MPSRVESGSSAQNLEMSVRTTFSSASQVIIDELRQKDKERNARENEKDKIIASMQAQLELITQNQSEIQSRGDSSTRPLRGRGSHGGPRGGGRGGRGGLNKADLTKADHEQDQSPSFLKNPKKRTPDSPSRGMTSGGFWSDDQYQNDSGGSGDGDPRKAGDWKIQKKKGFQKDREDKKKKDKLSKTTKRNSKDSLFQAPYVFLQEDADGRPDFPDLPKSKSPVKGFAAFTLTNAPTAAAVTAASISAAAVPVESGLTSDTTPVSAPVPVPTPVRVENFAACIQTNDPVSAPVQVASTSTASAGTVAPPRGQDISAIDKVLNWNDHAGTPGPHQQAPKQGGDWKTQSSTKLLEPSDIIKNDKGLREEIEVELKSLDGLAFRGSVTMIEAKHGIYRDCLGFRDFKNFDGVRINYKGVLIVTFKLKEAIDVDVLFPIQNFQFKRKLKIQGRLVDQIIECKIRGLRNQERNEKASFKNTVEGVTVVSLEGCDYRVKKEDIEAGLRHWGVLVSDLKETTFNDPHDTEGTNRTGIYCIEMKMSKRIPQIIPLCGRRVKIDYLNIQKLCTKCYGPHFRNICKQESKVQWHDYVEKFMLTHPDLPEGLYGKRQHEDHREMETKPTEDQFGVPTTKEQYNGFLVELIKTGLDYKSSVSELSRRHAAFKEAEQKYQAANESK